MSQKRRVMRPWIPRCKNLQNKREVVAMAQILKPTGNLKFDKRLIAEMCCEVWDWFDDETTDGIMSGVGLDAVDSQVELDGFGKAMESVGWIKLEQRPASCPEVVPQDVGHLSAKKAHLSHDCPTDFFLVIPNFDRWLGESSKKRHSEAYRKAKYRQSLISGGTNVPSNVGQEVGQMSENSRTKSAQEKEKEDKKNPPPPSNQNAQAVQDFDASPEGIAQAWCFNCSRRNRSGYGSQDRPEQIAPQISALIGMGVPPTVLLEEVQKRPPERNTNEHFWELEKRMRDWIERQTARRLAREESQRTREEIARQNEGRDGPRTNRRPLAERRAQMERDGTLAEILQKLNPNGTVKTNDGTATNN